jgi:hypothetical protein
LTSLARAVTPRNPAGSYRGMRVALGAAAQQHIRGQQCIQRP